MKTKVAIGLLIAAVAGLMIYGRITIEDLKTELDTINRRYAWLESDYSELETAYNDLDINYSTLQNAFNSVEGNYEFLSSQYEYLEFMNGILQNDYNEAISQNQQLENLLSEYERVPEGYYSTSIFYSHPNTYQSLCSFLLWEFRLPTQYQLGIFDCSESAAYLEWALETAGFDATIVVGQTPWNPDSGYHAWVIAYPEEYMIAIEPTYLTGQYTYDYLLALRTPGIVYLNDALEPGWENYYEGYDAEYPNIFYAIRDRESSSEWNWWEGFWGFK